MAQPKAIMSWSSGKDSAFALHKARAQGEVEIAGLLTTVSSEYDRVSMHGVRNELLDAQAQALGLPLHRVEIPAPCPNEVYEARMAEAVETLKADGISHFVFGDLFLRDIREYREKQLAKAGLTPLFPLWNIPTDALARDMLAAGLEAVIVCVDGSQLSPDFAGRWWDEELLADLPANIDPCGENGEFHTLVTAGPFFDAPLEVTVGEVVNREGFHFADVY
jgi:uncharacterized protein (TIGR00290 family)